MDEPPKTLKEKRKALRLRHQEIMKQVRVLEAQQRKEAKLQRRLRLEEIQKENRAQREYFKLHGPRTIELPDDKPTPFCTPSMDSPPKPDWVDP